MIFATEKYRSGSFPMPDRDNKKISNEEKDSPEYNLQIAQSIYASYCTGRTFGGYDLYSTIDKYRAYAYGEQDQEQYKDAFHGNQSTGPQSPLIDAAEKSMRRKAYTNLNFSIMSPAPRVVDALIGRISKATDNISVDAIDPYSTNLKEDMKWGSFVEGKFRGLFRTLNAIGGLPSEEPGYIPRNVEELNLYEAEGGYKPAYAEVMEEITKYLFDTVSKWEEMVQDRIIFDLVTAGFAGVEDVYDCNTGLVRVEYRDAKYVGVQYTKQDGFANPDWGFVVDFVKIMDLRAKGFKEESLVGAAKKFASNFGNPSTDDWSAENKNHLGYAEGYDEYVVPVLKVYWKDVDYERRVSYTNKYGQKRFDNYDGGKLGKRESLIESRIKYLRQAYWVIDTDMVYEYGKVPNQARDGVLEPVIPIHMFKTIGKPILPRIIPAIDMFQNAWMKFQHGMRMATLNGFTVELGAISNLSLGGKKLPPLEVLKMWRETGILFRKDSDVMGRVNVASRAIEPIAGGAGAVLKEALDTMQVAVNIIEQVTGINPITLGQTPTNDQGKGLTEYAMGSTDIILGQVVKPVNFMKASVARNLCLRVSQAVKESEAARKLYGSVVGDSRVELLRMAEGHEVKYGIKISVRPTDEEKQMLVEMISMSLKNGRDGKVGITEADAVRFFSMIKAGHSLKRVALLLDFANKKALEEAEAKAMRAQEAEAQKNESLKAMEIQSKQQEMMAKMQSDAASIQAKAFADLVLSGYDKGDIPVERAMAMLMGGGQQQQPPQQQVAPPQAQPEQVPMG